MKYPFIQLAFVAILSMFDIGYAIFDTYFSEVPSNVSFFIDYYAIDYSK